MGFEELAQGVNRQVSSILGIPATWTRQSGPPVSLPAIFRREHRVFDPETGAPVATTQSSAWVNVADLGGEPAEDDRFSIAGLEFVIAGLEPDGQGGMLLVLQRFTP
jgi:hypothetical protein